MKSLRISALMLALSAFSIGSIPSHAQQEIDPDHFDQPIAASTHVRSGKLQSHHSATATQRRNNKRVAGAPSYKAHPRQNARQTYGSSDVLGN